MCDERGAPASAHAVDLLRAAAEVLRRAGQTHPRGLCRWADPDLGDEVVEDEPR